LSNHVYFGRKLSIMGRELLNAARRSANYSPALAFRPRPWPSIFVGSSREGWSSNGKTVGWFGAHPITRLSTKHWLRQRNCCAGVAVDEPTRRNAVA
jgi:hypothetical protein